MGQRSALSENRPQPRWRCSTARSCAESDQPEVPTEATANQRFDRAGHAARDGAAARVLHEPHGTAASARVCRSTAGRTSSASRSGSSTSTCRRDRRASAPSGAFDIVVAAITRTDEWRQKNPGRTPLTPSSFRPAVSFSRDEFLDVLNRLDRFYSRTRGPAAARTACRSPAGRTSSASPTSIFDIYLAERL